MTTVPVPAVKVGDDARGSLAKHRAALTEANSNLTCSRQWYQKVRSGYAAQK